jgi:hypothetical protein
MSSKRFASRAVGLFAVSFLAVAMSLSVAIAGEFIPGDVNDDGSFNMVDSVVLRRALAGLGPGITQDPTCGNGLLDLDEDCDLGALGGRTCEDLGFSFGTLSCGAGCVFDASGCTNTRFVDNGDGTVSDRQSGLMWEQKVPGTACLHCVNDQYPWSPGFESSGLPTESASISDWLSTVNGLTNDPNTQSGLAGYSDWRIPSVVELQTILDCSFEPACIDPIFGPTSGLAYWSSSSLAATLFRAWGVGFSQGNMGFSDKDTSFHLRAVRGGLE